LRSRLISLIFSELVFGLPCCLPWARALAMPERTRSDISDRSNSARSYWIPGSHALALSEKGDLFLSLLKNKGFREESITQVGLYAIGTSTTLESNKSQRIHLLTETLPGSACHRQSEHSNGMLARRHCLGHRPSVHTRVRRRTCRFT